MDRSRLPLTAGGIHTALRSGRTAGIAIASHLLDDGPALDRALQGAYPRSTCKRLMRAAMDLPSPDALVELALDSFAFRAFARTVFFHHRNLSPTAWTGDHAAMSSADRPV